MGMEMIERQKGAYVSLLAHAAVAIEMESIRRAAIR